MYLFIYSVVFTVFFRFYYQFNWFVSFQLGKSQAKFVPLAFLGRTLLSAINGSSAIIFEEIQVEANVTENENCSNDWCCFLLFCRINTALKVNVNLLDNLPQIFLSILVQHSSFRELWCFQPEFVLQ